MSDHRRLVAYSASVAGTSHVRRGIGRQDQACHRAEKDFLIAAVADGAGSARESAFGALVATRRVTSAATWRLLQAGAAPDAYELSDILRVAVLDAKASLEQVARESGEGLGTYACTLLLTIQTWDLVGAAQIGDGGIVVSNGEGGFDSFTMPQRGEYANQTTFLTSSSGLEQMEVRVEEAQPNYLAMFSDGIQNLVVEHATQKPFQPFFRNIFHWLENQTDREGVEGELTNLLCSPKVTSKSDDDLTLLLAIRR